MSGCSIGDKACLLCVIRLPHTTFSKVKLSVIVGHYYHTGFCSSVFLLGLILLYLLVVSGETLWYLQCRPFSFKCYYYILCCCFFLRFSIIFTSIMWEEPIAPLTPSAGCPGKMYLLWKQRTWMIVVYYSFHRDRSCPCCPPCYCILGAIWLECYKGS